MTRAQITPPADVRAFVGIRFRPGEAFAFLDVVAADARDEELSPQDAGATDLGALLEVVRHAPAVQWPDVDRFLLTQLRRAHSPDERLRHAVSTIIGSGGATTIARVAAGAALSERQLERLFDERVGVSPKRFCRVVRFHQVVGAIDAHVAAGISRVPWAGLAVSIGYADQAHLARDVHAIAGVTPIGLARERMSDSFNTPVEPFGTMMQKSKWEGP